MLPEKKAWHNNLEATNIIVSGNIVGLRYLSITPSLYINRSSPTTFITTLITKRSYLFLSAKAQRPR